MSELANAVECRKKHLTTKGRCEVFWLMCEAAWVTRGTSLGLDGARVGRASGLPRATRMREAASGMRGTDPDTRAVPAMRVQRGFGGRGRSQRRCPRGRLPRLHLFAGSVRDAQRPEGAFEGACAESARNTA